MWTKLPFALFALVELEHETINRILQEGINGTSVPLLWLATDNYEDAPKKKRNQTSLGQEPPISDDWKSPFVGWKLDRVAKWLQDKPEDVDLDGHHFAVLDMKAKEGNVIVCKIGDKELEGDMVTCVLEPARYASDLLCGQEYGQWEEQFEGAHGRKKHVDLHFEESRIAGSLF